MGKPDKKTKAPGAVIVAGERWPLVLLKVTGKDDDGSPRTFELLRDDETTSTLGRPEFFTAYVHPGAVQRSN